MNQHKLERMNWLVRVDPRTKGSEDQVEAVEEMETLVDHKYVKQQPEPTVVQLDVPVVQQTEPKSEPPPGVQFNRHFKDGLNPRLNHHPIWRHPERVLNPCLNLRPN